MSRIPVSKGSGEMPEIEPGVYKAVCTRVKDDVIDNAQYGDGSIVRLYLQITDQFDGEGDPIELDAMASRKISPKSKLTRWAEALGRSIDFEDPNEDLDTEELVGRESKS